MTDRTGPAPIRIRLLGGIDIQHIDGTPITGLGRRAVALLACLAVSEAPWSRDELAELLWSGRSLDQQRGSLRQELLRLRRALGWQPNGDAAPGSPLMLPRGLAEVDVLAFRQALANPDEAASAVSLYRGPLLQGFRLDAADPFTAWLLRQRATLHTAAIDLMLGLLRSNQGSATLARRVLVLDPAIEEAHRYLIRHFATERDLGRALEQFRACADALRTARAAEPSDATRALLDEVTVELGARPAIATSLGPRDPMLDWIRHAPDRAPMPTTPDPQVLPPVEDRPSIAVLPFAALSHDTLATDVLADGMMEEVTNALARMPGFFVTARQSALVYRGMPIDVRRIAAELGVRYLVEGSVEQDRRRMRANLRLIEGRTGLTLWAESQDGLLDDLMGVRDTIVHRLASRLQPRLLMEEIRHAMRQPPQDLDAWSWLQRANGILLRGRHQQALEQALDPLQQALKADPRYAMANALLSAVYTWRALSQVFPDPQGEKRLARLHADAALADDPENPFVLAHCAETAIYTAADIDWALEMLERATSRDPNDANGLAMLAHVRRSAGEDPRGSLRLIDDALRLSPRDPRSFGWHHYANWCHFRLGELEEMEAACRRSIQLYGRYPLSWIGLTCALGLQDRVVEAREAAATLRRMRPSFSPEGFYQIARAFYGRRFEGQVDQEYRNLRSALTLAWDS